MVIRAPRKPQKVAGFQRALGKAESQYAPTLTGPLLECPHTVDLAHCAVHAGEPDNTFIHYARIRGLVTPYKPINVITMNTSPNVVTQVGIYEMARDIGPAGRRVKLRMVTQGRAVNDATYETTVPLDRKDVVLQPNKRYALGIGCPTNANVLTCVLPTTGLGGWRSRYAAGNALPQEQTTDENENFMEWTSTIVYAFLTDHLQDHNGDGRWYEEFY